MNYKPLYIAIALLLTMATNGWSQTINAKGTSGAPVSVSSATTVLDYKAGRKGWCIEPEGANGVRCEPSTSGSAPATTPSSTVGFLFPGGIITCHGDVPAFAAITNVQMVRLDCAATSGTISVDTWEE